MNNLPPLLGDGRGRYRVQIVGNSGSGKSTTGIALAAILGVPYISMDHLHWRPGWVESTREEFEIDLRRAMAQDERGWVVDGNHTKNGGLIATDASTDITWLDPPLYAYFPRIIVRTFLRLFRLGTPCSPGCHESFSEVFFSRESIIWWCISRHWGTRRRHEASMKVIGVGSGSDVANRRMRRFGGWGELKVWLKEVDEMIKAAKD